MRRRLALELHPPRPLAPSLGSLRPSLPNPSVPPRAHSLSRAPLAVNCCTIDWFSPWPPEALQAVAKTLMAKEAEQYDDKVFAGASLAAVVVSLGIVIAAVAFGE